VAPGNVTPADDAQAAPPPEPDTERDRIARAKGLKAPAIAGGGDPDLQRTLAAERPYLQALVVMVVFIVAGGFLLGAIGMVVGSLVGR
jgi:hypothetical protein